MLVASPARLHSMMLAYSGTVVRIMLELQVISVWTGVLRFTGN
jgi:hypothetical protein